MAGLMLLFLGRLDAARTHLETSTALFPDQHEFKLMRAVLEAFSGDRDAARRWLDDCKQSAQFSPDDLATLRDGLELIVEVRPLFENILRSDAGERRSKLVLRLLTRPRLVRLIGRHDTNALDWFLGKAAKAQPLQLPFRAPPLFARSLGNLVVVGPACLADKVDEQTLQQLERIVAANPEGTLYWLQGHLLFKSVQTEQEPGRQGRLLRQAHSAFETALRTPALFPIRSDALEQLILVEAAHLLGSGDDRAIARQVTAHLWERVASGPPIDPPGMKIPAFAKTALKAGDPVLAWRLLDVGEQLGVKPAEFASLREKIKHKLSNDPR
jgi:hypothetical protein